MHRQTLTGGNNMSVRPKIGCFEVTIKVMLDCDVDEMTAHDIVAEMDYDIGHILIQDTEIIADDITERFEGYAEPYEGT